MPFLEVNVKLNGTAIKSFVDTGSTLSVVSEKTFKRLNAPLIPNTAITLNQITGQTQTIGCFRTDLQIGSTTKSVTLHVINGCKYPLLLGLDAGKLFGLHLDLKHSKVSMPSNPSDNEHTSVSNRAPTTSKPTQQQSQKLFQPNQQQMLPQTKANTPQIQFSNRSANTLQPIGQHSLRSQPQPRQQQHIQQKHSRGPQPQQQSPQLQQKDVNTFSRNSLSTSDSHFLLQTEEIIRAQNKVSMDFVTKPIICNGLVTINNNGINKPVIPQSLQQKILKGNSR